MQSQKPRQIRRRGIRRIELNHGGCDEQASHGARSLAQRPWKRPMRIMLRTDATLLAERYAGSRPNNKKNRRIVFPVNTVVFLAVTLSMLIGAEETGRWKL